MFYPYRERLIAKYRPTMPVLSVVIPRLTTNQLKWSFSGAFEVNFHPDCVNFEKELGFSNATCQDSMIMVVTCL
jgi:hypothetical protein